MIRLENVGKIFHEGAENAFSALHDITLHVNAGEMLILKGISGSGKSTLLAMIGALLRPSYGSVIVDGQSVAKLSDLHASQFRRDTLGFIFQSFGLFEELSVADNVSTPLIHSGLSPQTLQERIDEAMKLARIEHKAERSVRLLSGGEKQRCAIARALVNHPKVILCDEPTANLDAANSEAFLETLLRLHTMGKTIVVATHDPIFDTLEQARLIHMDQGRLLT